MVWINNFSVQCSIVSVTTSRQEELLNAQILETHHIYNEMVNILVVHMWPTDIIVTFNQFYNTNNVYYAYKLSTGSTHRW